MSIRVNGAKIKAIREAVLDKNQTEFAEMAGLSQSYISMIEKENYCPSMKTVALIASVLGVRATDLLLEGEDVADEQQRREN